MKSNSLKVLTLLLSLLPFKAYSQDFDPKKIRIEIQSWWVPAFGHVHAAAMLPFGQTVSGTFTLNVRVVIHNNPSKVYKVYTSSDENIKFTRYVSLTCPYDGVNETNCAFNVPLEINTTLMSDGWREFLVEVHSTTPDGKKFLGVGRMPIYVDNGKADLNYTKFAGPLKPLYGSGYYTNMEYTYAKIQDVPRTPIRGTFTFKVHTRSTFSSHLTVELDKSHFIPAVGPWPEQPMSAGITLFDKDGTFSSDVPITIDTLKLVNGWHTLAAKSVGVGDGTSVCSYCGPEPSKLAGVAKIWFYVQN